MDSETFGTWVNTTEWPNGEHEVYAVVSTVDAGETITDDDTIETNNVVQGIGVSASVIAEFDNYISQFFVAASIITMRMGLTVEGSEVQPGRAKPAQVRLA